MALFDRKPVAPLEALQWDGRNFDAIADWVGQDRIRYVGTHDSRLEWSRLEWLELWCGTDGAQGWVPVPVDHWIAKSSPTDLYPIDPEYFDSHFTPHQED